MRQQELDLAIADGRLTVRTMTAEEREESDARVTAAKARGARPRRPRYG